MGLLAIVVIDLDLVIEHQRILVLFREAAYYADEVTMVDRGPDPHTPQREPKMERHVVIVMAFQNNHCAQLFAT